MTPAAERLTTLAGAVADGFGKGADLLKEMAAINLSESTVQRTTEHTGQRIGQTLEQGRVFGAAEPWDWHLDYQGQRCAYVGVDGIIVPQQGPNGTAAEGRQAYVGVLFNPTPEYAEPKPKRSAELERPKSRASADPEVPARYVAGMYSLAELEPVMRRQGAQLGMDAADVWVGISDGGSGLENFLHGAFPRLEAVIVDYWHASEYLADLAKALHPGDGAAMEAKRSLWCGLLLDEGGTLTLAYLREESWPPHAAAAWTVTETYLENQQHRMEYPEYRARGWCIGSGVVESGCKTVVAQRLKLAGMRWGEDGADAVCHVRAIYRGDKDQWEALWHPSAN